jgi:hypothetical protein
MIIGRSDDSLLNADGVLDQTPGIHLHTLITQAHLHGHLADLVTAKMGSGTDVARVAGHAEVGGQGFGRFGNHIVILMSTEWVLCRDGSKKRSSSATDKATDVPPHLQVI